MTAATPRSRRQLAQLLGGSAGAGLLLAGSGALVLALTPAGDYLALQAASDTLHRLIVFALPAAALVLVVVWTLSELGRLSRLLRRLGTALAAGALALLVSLGLFIALFDARLEAVGLLGQRVPAVGDAGLGTGACHLLAEPSAEVPNLVSEPLAGGDVLALDRRTLSRKRPDGSFAWHRPRPGPPPGWLLLCPEGVVYGGRGARWEDDSLLVAVGLDGAERARWHGLGAAVPPPSLDGADLALVTWRPVGSTVRLFELPGLRLRWARPLSREPRGPARLAPDRVVVPASDGALSFDRSSGDPVAPDPPR